MAEAARKHPGAMAAILGLDDEIVETLCRKILGVWPANYNCPGQIVVSGEHIAVDECCSEAESAGARRTMKLKVSGAFHSPLVARAADRLRPAVEAIHFKEPIHPFMSTVTTRIESAPRLATLLVDQLTAPVKFTQAATELVRGGVRTFVEVGPGNVLSGLVKRIDQSVETVSVNNLASLAKLEESLASVCSLEGKTALVTGGSRGIGRAIAVELARGGATVVVGYRSGADERLRSRRRSAAARSRPTSRAPRTRRGSWRRQATSTSSSTTRASPATACWRGCPTTTGAR